jgi:hypothetical protein
VRFYVAGFISLCSLISACSTHSAVNSDAEFEPQAKASMDEWRAIKGQVREVDSIYGKPNDFGVVLQQVHTKMCLPGFTAEGNMQVLINNLKFKAFAIGATGITKLDLHIAPWSDAPRMNSNCLKGYLEGTATALILNRERFPETHPQ